MRYTERHGGVAVIKDKSKHKEAMEKLAKVEDEETIGLRAVSTKNVQNSFHHADFAREIKKIVM